MAFACCTSPARHGGPLREPLDKHMDTVGLHVLIKFERQASKHARLAGTTVALNTLRYPRRAARGQHEGARCGCFGSQRLPASIAQLLTPATRMADACPPRSTCGRATNRREKAFTFYGHWWPGSARTWPDRCACGVISARALRRVNMERF